MKLAVLTLISLMVAAGLLHWIEPLTTEGATLLVTVSFIVTEVIGFLVWPLLGARTAR